MSVRVVCISRALFAGGEEIGRGVAASLGFRYVDEQIIRFAASEARVDPAVVARTERRQPLLDQLLAKLPSGRGLAGAVGLALGVGGFSSGPREPRAVPDDMRALIRWAIGDVARQGDAVIVAHAASLALAGAADLLRVLVTASPETRAARLAAADGVAVQAAAATIADSDRERRDYFRNFYRVEEELPTHYDVTINTDRLEAERALAVILAAARA